MSITVTFYSWAPSTSDHLYACGTISRPSHWATRTCGCNTRDDHGAGVMEWTLAGVCVLGWSGSRSQHFRFEPESEPEPESTLRSVQELIKTF